MAVRRSWLLSLGLASLLVAAAASSGRSVAGPQGEQTLLYLAGVAFDPTAGPPPAPPWAAATLADSSEGLYVVQFTADVGPRQQALLQGHGAAATEYVPRRGLMARLSAQAAHAIGEDPTVRAVVRVQPHMKLAPELRAAAGGGGRLLVSAFTAGDVAGIVAAARGLGATVAAADGRAVRLEAPAGAALALAALPGTRLVSPEPTYVLLNDRATGVLQAATAWDTLGLDGRGQVVAIADTGLDKGAKSLKSIHPGLRGRVKKLFGLAAGNASGADYHGHGTHVAGSAVGSGAGSTNNAARGLAPAAGLVLQSIGDTQGNLTGVPADLNTLFQQATAQRARLHSNSWGASAVPYYSVQARQADEFMWTNRDVLILFAAGNDGPDAATIISPGTFKNGLTVGASENNRPEKGTFADNPDTVFDFSSRGWAGGVSGRVKPDLVAPGSWVLSARSALAPASRFDQVYDRLYAYKSGTSMATPLAAGAAALVRQYFADRLGVGPRASLVKAALINGATPLGGVSMRLQGWGRLDLSGTFRAATDGYGLMVNEDVALSNGETATYTVNVPEGTGELVATLAWTDSPGLEYVDLLGVSPLINDLDLTLIAPDGSGNCYNPRPDVACAVDDLLSHDTVNNVESVRVSNPAPGTWTVRVRGSSVQSPQSFALVVRGGGPAATLAGPADGVRRRAALTATSPAAGQLGGIRRVAFYTPEGALIATDDTSPFSAEWDVSALPDGTYAPTAKVFFGNGSVARTAGQVVVDRSVPDPPTISLARTAGKGSVTFTVTASDGDGIDGIALTIARDSDAAEVVNRSFRSSPAKYRWTTSKLPNGAYTAAAVATDQTGEAATATLAVTVNNTDKTKPKFTGASAAVVGSTVTIGARASDLNGVASMRVMERKAQVGTTCVGQGECSFTLEGVARGSHTYTLEVYDPRGNRATKTLKVKVP